MTKKKRKPDVKTTDYVVVHFPVAPACTGFRRQCDDPDYRKDVDAARRGFKRALTQVSCAVECSLAGVLERHQRKVHGKRLK
jgi:hypothetical protein